MAEATVIYLTASELPESFASKQRDILKSSVGDLPIISVSRKPLDFGINLLDTEPRSMSNIYFQLLRAAKVATTDYIIVAEDDTLYPPEHFTFHRPPLDTFAYNQHRWALFTWGRPMYSWRNRKSNATLIAPRKLLIETLEERFAKYPNGTPEEMTGEVGRPFVEKLLGVTERKSVEVYSEDPVVQFNHEHASEVRQRTRRKNWGPLRAFDIPYWGKASEVVKLYGVHKI